MSTAVLLIPGFFGFGQFGKDDGGPKLEYFASVRDVLEQSAQEKVVVHEPPPTGSLNERVASLHDKVRELRADYDYIHLIGHSTGGVDAWLYTRPGFRWAGGPEPAQRSDLLGAIGDVVTLSAPFRGTPIATYARRERDVFLMGVFALTVLTSAKGPVGTIATRTIARLAVRLLHATSAADQMSTLAATMEGLREELPFVDDLEKFFKEIVEDRQLMRDLEVKAMTDLVKEPTKGNHARIRSYVSVSPAPVLSVSSVAAQFLDFENIPLAALYAQLYNHTAAGSSAGKVPTLLRDGELFGSVAGQLADPRASDGIVPVRSQTLNGEAAGIVFGDHLDVTGHYGDAPRQNVFKSGADFDDERFEALWTKIGSELSKKA